MGVYTSILSRLTEVSEAVTDEASIVEEAKTIILDEKAQLAALSSEVRATLLFPESGE